jgi:hypothetical protein
VNILPNSPDLRSESHWSDTPVGDGGQYRRGRVAIGTIPFHFSHQEGTRKERASRGGKKVFFVAKNQNTGLE